MADIEFRLILGVAFNDYREVAYKAAFSFQAGKGYAIKKSSALLQLLLKKLIVYLFS